LVATRLVPSLYLHYSPSLVVGGDDVFPVCYESGTLHTQQDVIPYGLIKH
jgi:hypothetical protein